MKPIAVCILFLLVTGTTVADDYQPLETGNFWSYVSDEGASEMRVVGEQVPIFQGHPYPIVYTDSDGNQGLINYWTSEPDGGVLLWGFSRPTWGILYQPPIRMVDAPLFVGKIWPNTVDLYSLPDTTFYMTMEFNYEVHEDPELTVPAGSFPTFGIGDPAPGATAILGGHFTLWGEALTDKSPFVDRWYSEGVGVVQEYVGHLLQLETYTDHPVAMEVSTWGAVKALYRGAP